MNTFPLWKRCRALANSLRLDMLECLDRRPNRCVKEIAEALGIADNVASKNLQFLASAGFVTQRHVGKYLYYALDEQDELLVPALGLVKESGKEQPMFMVTATTHERRIKIIAALNDEPVKRGTLCIKTHISPEAMNRQLGKLVRRGFVRKVGEVFWLQDPECALGRKLIKLALLEFTPAQV